MTDPDSSSAADRITEAAMLLIVERGMSSVTMSAVAERAGVSRQTVYNHFPDLDSIVLAVHERHDVMDHAEALLGTAGTATQKIDLLIRHTIGAYAHTRGTVAIEHGLAPVARESLRRHARRGRDLIAALLEQGVETHVFRADLDPEIDARLLQGTLAAAGEAAAEPGADVPHITDAAARAILAALENPELP
jgi:AcrR family transcriptional regulator